MAAKRGVLKRSTQEEDVTYHLENKNTLKKDLRHIAISLQIWPSKCSSFTCNACESCTNELQLIHYRLYLLLKKKFNYKTYTELSAFHLPITRNTGKELFRFCMFVCHECCRASPCQNCLDTLQNIVEPLFTTA